MSVSKRPGQQVKFKTVEELLGVVGEESSMEIEIYLIHPFKNHPFKVVDDSRMDDLVESIKANGVLSPVLIRPAEKNTYEMISGHRRLHAAKLAGLTTVPAIIRELTDDESTIAMVDANIQREELLPSEKAFAYKMKLDAMKRQAGRPANNSCQNGTHLRSDQELGNQIGESARSIQRYIRLTELIPELLDFVDNKRMQFTVGVEASYIDQEVQKWLYEYIKDNGPIKLNQISLLRTSLQTGAMTQEKLIDILNGSQPGRKQSSNINFTEKKLRKYFPADYTADEMRSVIEELLLEWKNSQSEVE